MSCAVSLFSEFSRWPLVVHLVASSRGLFLTLHTARAKAGWDLWHADYRIRLRAHSLPVLTVGFSIGVFLILADEIQSLNFIRIGSMSLRGAAAGILGGLVGGVCAQILYTLFMSVIGVALLLKGPAAKPFVVFARSISWALTGCGCWGVSWTCRKVTKTRQTGRNRRDTWRWSRCFLFDGLAAATQGGSASRA